MTERSGGLRVSHGDCTKREESRPLRRLNYLSDLVFRSHRAVTQSGGLSPSAITYDERIAAAIRRRAPREARRVMLQHLDDVIRRADQLFGEGFGPPAGADGTPQRVASAPVRAIRTR
jgi:hypothetical protein